MGKAKLPSHTAVINGIALIACGVFLHIEFTDASLYFLLKKVRFEWGGSWAMGMYEGMLLGVHNGKEFIRFDTSRYSELYRQTEIGQPISIRHYSRIRDDFLEISLHGDAVR